MQPGPFAAEQTVAGSPPEVGSCSRSDPRPSPPVPAARPWYRLAKRAVDASGAGLGLLAGLPLLAWVALRVRLQDGGPALFHQTRVGQDGRHFTFYKFRSMAIDAEARLADLQAKLGGPVRFKLEADPRVTPFGTWLRQTSLDELPQLWNVLKGDMSLVGPRPPLPSEVERYDERQRVRLTVPQGLTCLWQVRGRSLLGFQAQVALDLEYIERRGLLFDLGILLRTPGAVLSRRGAW